MKKFLSLLSLYFLVLLSISNSTVLHSKMKESAVTVDENSISGEDQLETILNEGTTCIFDGEECTTANGKCCTRTSTC